MKTCGECDYFRPFACKLNQGKAVLSCTDSCADFLPSRDVLSDYDKTVDELIKVWIESSAIIRERCPYEWAFITKAIAAVRKAREAREPK